MRNIILYALLGLGIFFTSCNKLKPKPISNSINKIMPLGASRVEGGQPDFESFRYELWKDLVDGSWDFDFTGTMTDEGTYADYAGEIFDADHEGRGGWTSGQIAEDIDHWIELVGVPDIVLFSSPGGNDALTGEPYGETIANINSIIDAIQASNPNVTIIIEQMAPARSDAMTTELTSFMDQILIDIPNIATAQTNSPSTVIAIDMNTGFTDSFFADDVHYNALGAKFIATKYYEVLSGILK
jgi:lysophospholipase L1-like esterase